MCAVFGGVFEARELLLLHVLLLHSSPECDTICYLFQVCGIYSRFAILPVLLVSHVPTAKELEVSRVP